MKKAYISVNRQTIDRNRKQSQNQPPISYRIGKYGKPTYVHELDIKGPCKLIYNAETPILKCGARLVIVTDANNL